MFLWALARVLGSDEVKLKTGIFFGAQGRRTICLFSLPRTVTGALFCPLDVLLSLSAAQ